MRALLCQQIQHYSPVLLDNHLLTHHGHHNLPPAESHQPHATHGSGRTEMSRAGGSPSMEPQHHHHQTPPPAHFYPWSTASPWVTQEFGSHQSDATRPRASHLQVLQAWLCLFERSHNQTHRLRTSQLKTQENHPLSPICGNYFYHQWDIFAL